MHRSVLACTVVVLMCLSGLAILGPAGSVTAKPPPNPKNGPDLYVSNIRWTDVFGTALDNTPTMTSGQAFTVYATVVNQGNMGCSGFYTFMAIDGVGVGSVYWSAGLIPGDSVELSWTNQVVSAAGAHTATATADSQAQIGEKNEGNNVRTESFNMQLAQWLFAVYLDADINIEDEGIYDFLETAQAGSTTAVSVVVQMDRAVGFDNGYDDWTTAKRYFVRTGTTPNNASALQDLGEVDMGNPATLTDFGTWAFGRFGAQKRALVLWDHGGGWIDGFCKDDSSGNNISTSELRTAITTLSGQLGKQIDVVAFDACYMGMMEVGYVLRGSVSYFVGSEEMVPGLGYPYAAVINELRNDPGIAARDFTQRIVADFNASYAPILWGANATLASNDVSQLVPSVSNCLTQFANALINDLAWHKDQINASRIAADDFYDYPPDTDPHLHLYVDLYGFAAEVRTRVTEGVAQNTALDLMNALNAARVAVGEQADHYRSNGLSIYWPECKLLLDPYHAEGLSMDTTWDDFLNAYYGYTAENPPTAPGKPSADANDIKDGQYRVSWAASVDNDATPVRYYYLEEQVNGGAWTQIKWTSLTYFDIYTYRVPATYNYRVYADDTGGRVGPYSPVSDPVVVPWDVRMTNNVAQSNNAAIAVDTFGNYHIVWVDARDGNNEIYYKKVDVNWNVLIADTRLTVNSADSSQPSIAVASSGKIEVAWSDMRDSVRVIYTKNYDPTTGTWGADVRAMMVRLYQMFDPDVAADSAGNFHVVARGVYRDTKYDNQIERIFYMPPGGAGNGFIYENFTTDSGWYGGVISTDRLKTPRIDFSGTSGVLHLIFLEGASGETIGLRYMKYAGGVWSTAIRLWTSPLSAVPSGCNLKADYSSGRVYAVLDMGYYDGLFIRSDNNGVTWQAPVVLNVYQTYGLVPDIESRGDGYLVLVWKVGGGVIHYMTSTNWGVTWSLSTPLSGAGGVGYAQMPRIVYRAGEWGVVWYDSRDGNNEIYFTGKRFF